MKTIDKIITGLVAIIFVFGIAKLIPQKEYGSVQQSSEYIATSTASNSLYGGFTGDTLLKTGWGTLGSVVITGANTGIINIYNATTSDVNKRTNKIATTSILMASIPANTTAGTYIFDTIFTTGLLIELETGNMPTTTITYR